MQVRALRGDRALPVKKPAPHVAIAVEFEPSRTSAGVFVDTIAQQVNVCLQLGCEYITVYEKSGLVKRLGSRLAHSIASARAASDPIFEGRRMSCGIDVVAPHRTENGSIRWEEVSHSRWSSEGNITKVRLLDYSDGRL